MYTSILQTFTTAVCWSESGWVGAVKYTQGIFISHVNYLITSLPVLVLVHLC